MTPNLRWACAAVVTAGAIGVIFKKPRTIVITWARRLIRHTQLHLYLQHRDDTKRAIERMAAELAQRRCDDEGNLDEEYWLDWYRWFTRWFTGDPTVDVNYRRKQERDLDQVRRTEFRKPAAPDLDSSADVGATTQDLESRRRRKSYGS